MKLLSFFERNQAANGKLGGYTLDNLIWESPSSSSFDVCDWPISKETDATTIAKRIRTVRFNDDVQILEISSRSEMTSKEKKGTWYRKRDLKRIQGGVREVAQRMKQQQQRKERGEWVDDDNDDDENCVRGLLEDGAHPYALQRCFHKLFQRNLVFELQARQILSYGKVDPILLGTKSLEFSARCRHATFVASLPKDRTPKRGFIN